MEIWAIFGLKYTWTNCKFFMGSCIFKVPHVSCMFSPMWGGKNLANMAFIILTFFTMVKCADCKAPSSRHTNTLG